MRVNDTEFTKRSLDLTKVIRDTQIRNKFYKKFKGSWEETDKD